MDTFTSITRTRRLIWTGIIIGLVLATLFTVLRIVNAEQIDFTEVLGSVALGVAAGLPAGFAWLSLDRRPGLLPMAAIAALILGVASIVLFAPWLIAAIIWLVAARGRPRDTRSGWRPAAHRVGLVLLAVAAFAVLFVHTDPFCTETLRDGTVNAVDAGSHGFGTGWSFNLTTSGSSSSGAGPDVASTFCTSDRIVAGEALASLGISAVALALARRWPANSTPTVPPHSDTRMAV